MFDLFYPVEAHIERRRAVKEKRQRMRRKEKWKRGRTQERREQDREIL